jgi:hypothetical protein
VLYDAYADRRDAAVGQRALARFRELSGQGDFSFTSCPYVWLARDGDGKRAAAIRGAPACGRTTSPSPRWQRGPATPTPGATSR